MSQVYRFRSKEGVEMKLELEASEFKRRVKRGKLKMPSRLFGGTTTYTLIGTDKPATTGCFSACYPMWSDAMGINPDQIQEQTEYDRKLGVEREIHPETGQIRFDSPRHRKEYCEAHGFFDRNGSYSDPQRLNYREKEARAMAGRSVHRADD